MLAPTCVAKQDEKFHFKKQPVLQGLPISLLLLLFKGRKPGQLATHCTTLSTHRLAQLQTCISMSCRSSDEEKKKHHKF